MQHGGDNLVIGPISEAAPEPLHRQIAEGFKREVREGRLSPGAALPSVRQVAESQRVSLATALGAFEQLERDGFLHWRQGLGACIADRLPADGAKGEIPTVRERLIEAVQAARIAGLNPAEILHLTRAVATPNAVEICGLTRAFPNSHLGPLDLMVPRGSIFGLIGTTAFTGISTFELLFGRDGLLAGEIRVLGQDYREIAKHHKHRLAYAGPASRHRGWGRVGRAIRFARWRSSSWDDALCARLMTIFQLHENDIISSLPQGGETRLALLVALSRRPDILVLDEPTAGLDVAAGLDLYGELLRFVEDGERAVILATRALAEVERFADHVAFIKDGAVVVAGPTPEVLDRYRMADFFADDEAEFDRAEGFTVVNREKNRWRALVDRQMGLVEWVKDRGARQIALAPVTIEELFVALARR